METWKFLIIFFIYSQGTATVEYEDAESASKAIKDYNGRMINYINFGNKTLLILNFVGAELDGQTLVVEYDTHEVPSRLRKPIQKEKYSKNSSGGFRTRGY